MGLGGGGGVFIIVGRLWGRGVIIQQWGDFRTKRVGGFDSHNYGICYTNQLFTLMGALILGGVFILFCRGVGSFTGGFHQQTYVILEGFLNVRGGGGFRGGVKYL